MKKGRTCNKCRMIPCLSFLTLVHLCITQSFFRLTSSPTTASPPFSDEWVVLLTTTRKRNDPESTKSHELLYMKQIAQWASKSTLPIFVIESSGIGFPELEEKEYPNLHVIPKDIHYNGTSSSIGEALSLIEAAKKMDEYKEIMSGKNYIMKVTGRYYFEGAKKAIDKLTIGKDFYVQRHFNDVITWQNTEYLGIKKELLPKLGNKVIEGNSMMEETFYNFTRDADKSFEYFGKGFKNDQPRGGDKIVINPIR